MMSPIFENSIEGVQIESASSVITYSLHNSSVLQVSTVANDIELPKKRRREDNDGRAEEFEN